MATKPENQILVDQGPIISCILELTIDGEIIWSSSKVTFEEFAQLFFFCRNDDDMVA